MGNCYSNQGRHSQQAASGSVLPQRRRRPSQSVDSISVQSDSGALSFLQPYEIDDPMDGLHAPPYSKSRPSTHRGFGFRAPSSRSALQKARSDSASVTSSANDLRGSNLSLEDKAFAPKDQKHWRMIDDESRSMSMKSGESVNNKLNKKTTDEDVVNANVMDNQKEKTHSKLPQAKRGLSAPRGPLAKFSEGQNSNSATGRGWVKASADTAPTPGKKAEKTDKSESKLIKKPEKRDSKQTVPPKEEKRGIPQSRSRTGFLKRGFFKKSKSAPINVEKETLTNVPYKDSTEDIKQTKELKDIKVPEREEDKQLSSDLSERDSRIGTEDVRNKEIEEEMNTASMGDLLSMAPSIAPMASLDNLDTGSIGSINSDDLMLDLDIDGLDDVDYEEKESTQNRSRSNSGPYKVRPRSKSHSNDDPDENQRHSVQHQDSVKKVSAGALQKESIVESPCEALDELASLLDNNPLQALLRRNPRIAKASRPSSFPGPRTARLKSEDSPDEPTMSMKPPRDSPSFGDDEIVTIDGFTYRQLLQDIRTYKTMLLKLKRVIQQNGLMFPGSNPSSPCTEESISISRPVVGESPTTENNILEDLVRENLELKEQNQSLNKQREQQDRTIKLLQQQMENTNGHKLRQMTGTKYECGHLGPGGKSFSNATVQTERLAVARLPRYEGRDKPAAKSADSAAKATTAAGQRQRGELRSSLSCSENKLPPKKPDEKRDLPRALPKPVPRSKSITEGRSLVAKTDSQSDLPHKSADVLPKRPLSTGSKMPALRVQRYTRTEAHQLRSFSNVAKQSS